MSDRSQSRGKEQLPIGCGAHAGLWWRLMRQTLLPLLAVVALLVAACTASTPARQQAAANEPASPATSTVPLQQDAASAQAAAAEGTITVYSGRNEKLIGPLVARFQQDTGIEVKVRYGDTAELAAAILEEGRNSPADVFFAQDGGALGALATAQRLVELPLPLLERVEPRFRSADGKWVGISGRARTVIYNTDELRLEDLPDSIDGFTDPRWKGKIGWAPTNGSFQSFVTALRLTKGDEATKQWLEGIQANSPKVYANNTAIVTAVGAGEVQVGFVNHYYLFRFLDEQGEGFAARNYHPRAGDAGAMINVAGVGILNTAQNPRAAERFIDYLLAEEAQQYFADETKEYPLVPSIKTHPMVTPMSEIAVPDIDLSSLSDLENTLKMLHDAGVL